MKKKRTRKSNIEGYPRLKYETKPVKKGKKILWHVIESTSSTSKKNVVAKCEFKDDAEHLVEFHNKHQVWRVNMGIPKMLWNY
tara:strand:- start:761 stop:1009 length:249 start_codon:yes stop_codon:yes gene_type:complete